MKALIEITEDELRMLKNNLCDIFNQNKAPFDPCLQSFLGSLHKRIEAGTMIPRRFDESWIRSAIYEATGLQFEDYTSKSRREVEFYARIIYTHQILRISNLDLSVIAERLNRTIGNVSKYRSRYEEFLKYDKGFRILAEIVDEYLSKVYHSGT